MTWLLGYCDDGSPVWHREPPQHIGILIRGGQMIIAGPDPLAPPEGYGERAPAGQSAGPWATEPDLTCCNMAPCRQPPWTIWSLACENEHVFEAAYCQSHAMQIQPLRLTCSARYRGKPGLTCGARLVVARTRVI